MSERSFYALGTMLRLILSACGLFALWLLMSGIYKPLVIWLGVASAIGAALMIHRMDRLDGHRLRYALSPIRGIGYFLWLLREIAISNIAVTRVILSGGTGMRQNLFRVPNTQKTELGAVAFATSITLTPGTLTVEVEEDYFWVHALAFSDDDHAALADMDARVTALEGK